jgi:hypothetical protein
MRPRPNNIYTKTPDKIIVFDLNYFTEDFRELIYSTTDQVSAISGPLV